MESTAVTDPDVEADRHADALARRTWAAKSWVATGDRHYRNAAIAAHTEATAHPEHRP